MVDTLVGWSQSQHSGPPSSALTVIQREICKHHFLALRCLEQSEASLQISGSRFLSSRALDSDPLLVSILLRRQRLRLGLRVALRMIMRGTDFFMQGSRYPRFGLDVPPLKGELLSGL